MEIAHKMLVQQLKELENDQLILRKEYPQVPPKVEYALTPMGRDLEPVVQALTEWINHYQTLS